MWTGLSDILRNDRIVQSLNLFYFLIAHRSSSRVQIYFGVIILYAGGRNVGMDRITIIGYSFSTTVSQRYGNYTIFLVYGIIRQKRGARGMELQTDAP